MMGFERRENNALNANPNFFHYPQSADITNNTHGSDWLWAVTALMALTTLAIIGVSFMVPRRNRIFHHIAAAITLIGTINYFTMASNLGYAAIQVEFIRTKANVTGRTREIFYVRYIDWFITTPLILLAILLTARAPRGLILWTIFLDWVMVVTALVGALTASSYKWGYFVFALFSLFGIAFNLLWSARLFSNRFGPTIRGPYLLLSGWTIFFFFLYPICWGISEGGNVISVIGEMVFYGILDIMTKIVFVGILLFSHRSIDPDLLGVSMRDYTDDLHNEKYGGAGGIGGTTGGVPATTGTTTTGTTGVVEPTHPVHTGV